jgi:predicted dehydrogenase
MGGWNLTNEIGVGVIGFGVAARVFHCPFVSAVPGLRLRTIVQRRGNEAAVAYPDVALARSVDELLTDPGVGLVVIATPNETHYELAVQALTAGKHVVVDKPFATSSQQAGELIELAQELGLVLAPFHNRRWDGDFVTLRKIVKDGVLGRLVTIESHFDRYRPMLREGTWKEAESPANGLLFDLGPHLIDQAFALFGPPNTVTANVRANRDGTRIEDAFDISLGYDGLIFWGRSSLLACDPAPRFLVHGTSGSFKKFGVDPQEPALIAGAKVPRVGEGDWLAENEAMWGELTIAPSLSSPGNLVKTRVRTELGDYRGFYRNVLDAIHGNAELCVSAAVGSEVVRVLELARASSLKGQTLKFK